MDAILNGGPAPALPVPNLATALLRAAKSVDGRIVHVDGTSGLRTRTYAELLHDATRAHAGLRELGVRPGDVVVLQVADEPELLTAFWACQLGGFVAAPVAAVAPPGSTRTAAESRDEVAAMLDTPWVVQDSVAQPRSSAPAGEIHPARPDDLAALLLTSGSTGLPKAVRLTHRNILSRAVSSAGVRGLSRHSRTLNWMPLDHVGGLVMFHVRDVLLGCHQTHARTGWVLEDPLRWLDLASEHRCDTTWAPNFAFGLVTDRAGEISGRDWDLSRLGYVMNGGEPIRPGTARRFLGVLAPFGLPSTAMHPGWGMSETSAGVVDCVFSPEDGGDDRFVPVGRPHPGVSVRIVDSLDQVLAAGEIGRVQVTGDPVTAGYHGHEGLSFSADGWFTTGDLGFVADGALTVTGRADDVVRLDGTTCYRHEIEAAVEELPFVEKSFTLARTEADGSLTVSFHPVSGRSSDLENWQIVEQVATRLGIQVSRVCPVGRDEVAKTGIGKLKRVEVRHAE